jgi:hypothetical protein
MKRILISIGAIILVIFCLCLATVIVLFGQTPRQLRVITDANDALMIASAVQTLPLSQPTLFTNARLRTDASGNLLVTGITAGSAPSTATYITQTADAGLSAEQPIGALASGILRGATTTGVITSLGDFYLGTTATITSGFSTTAPSIVGKASAFAVTIAATPGITGTVAFNGTFANIPSVNCTNTITANLVQAVPTTTTVVLNGVWIAGDIIRCIAIGF